MKLFLFDCETTSLNFETGAIHQISGCVIIDNMVIEKFDWHIKPHEGSEIIEEALKTSNVDINEINLYPPAYIVYNKLITLLNKYINRYDKSDKFTIIGYNTLFDVNFLRQFFLRNNDKFYGSYFYVNYIDVMVLATEYLLEVRTTMKDFKLRSVAEKLNINFNEELLHSAYFDAILTLKVYSIITNKKITKQST